MKKSKTQKLKDTTNLLYGLSFFVLAFAVIIIVYGLITGSDVKDTELLTVFNMIFALANLYNINYVRRSQLEQN